MKDYLLVLRGIGAALALSIATPIFAQGTTGAMVEPRDNVSTLEDELKQARDRIDRLEARLRLLEESSQLRAADAVGDRSLADMRGRGIGTAIQQTPPLQGSGDGAVQPPTRRAPAPTDAVETVSRAQQQQYGSRFTLESGMSYSHFTNAQLNLSGFLALDAIFLGLISLDEVESDVVTSDLTARYGLTDRLSLDLNVPYLVRKSTFKSGGAGGNAAGLAEKSVTARGLGDVSLGASYRLFRETSSFPDVVINARIKAPSGRHPFGVELEEVPDTEGNLAVPRRLSTGSGTWAAAGGVSLLKTLDPMVIFGSLTYFHNFGASFDDIDEAIDDQPGKVRLGNALQYGLGVAFALNERSSLSTSFTQRFVRRSKLKLDGDDRYQTIIGSDANVGVLNLGATFSLSERIALLSNLGIGITADAPDMVVSFRLPYRF